jgi:hypothetical protein
MAMKRGWLGLTAIALLLVTRLASAAVEDSMHGVVVLAHSTSSGQAHFKTAGSMVYPMMALERRIEGCVVVTFEIGDDGLSDHYMIYDAVTKGLGFDKAALLGLNDSVFVVPQKPGRYAVRVDFQMRQAGNQALADLDAISPARDCKPIPTYEELNPTSSAGK